MNVSKPFVKTCVVITILASTALWADTAPARLAIGGYSPVSYFTESKPERGSPEFPVEHDGHIYHLTSREQVHIFEQNPDRYRPRHRACPYSLAFGMVLPLDPTNFKIVGNTLLLFHLSEEKDALLEWNRSSISEEELIRRADANAFLIEF